MPPDPLGTALAMLFILGIYLSVHPPIDPPTIPPEQRKNAHPFPPAHLHRCLRPGDISYWLLVFPTLSVPLRSRWRLLLAVHLPRGLRQVRHADGQHQQVGAEVQGLPRNGKGGARNETRERQLKDFLGTGEGTDGRTAEVGRTLGRQSRYSFYLLNCLPISPALPSS